MLFCLSFPSLARAQREVQRTSILEKARKERAAEKPAADTTVKADQGTALAPGTGSVMGVVLDSLHSSMLADAGVTVIGAPGRHAVTTDAGMFRIDSIPPGKYILELTHPVIDSLGMRVVSDTIAVTDGQVQTVEFAIPSVNTITASVCTPAKLRFGPGVILGRVIDAGTQKPAVGAEVSVAWKETIVNSVVGVRSMQRVRKATVEADGMYRICGVPANLTGTLQAIQGEAQTAEVPIAVADQHLSMRMLFLPPAAVAAGDSTQPDSVRSSIPRGVIVGRVTNAGGVPVDGARVSVQGNASSVSTGADGKFTLTGVMPGTQSVLVRRVGYSPVETPLDVVTAETNQLTVRLGTYSPMLSSVDVTAKADPLESTGFERRRKMGFGRYMDLDAINASHPTYTSDILRHILGLVVTGSGVSTNVTTTRGNGCVRFMVDNNNVSVDGGGQSIDQVVGAQELAAVEFYNPVDVPMELSAGNNGGCALVVIWTKGKLQPPKK
jgi:hypothetical protein